MLSSTVSQLPWKQNKSLHPHVRPVVKIAVMEEFVNLESDLQPCGICGRKFLPPSLGKHAKVCERNTTRKRKVFDSLKQRVEGTEIAQFHQRSYLKKPSAATTPEPPVKVNKWREKHVELVNTIRRARDMTTSPSRVLSTTAVGSERCPSCDRQFGPRAYERHVEWCKQRKAIIQKSPADVQLAKERLEARTKYRVPLPNKSKRELVKEKYTPTKLDLKGSSSNLERTLSVRKPKSVSNLSKAKETHSHENFVNMPIHEKEPVKTATRPSKCVPPPEPDPIKSANNTDYNPFLTAERQLMELLQCDDFTPFLGKSTSQQRPHTTGNSKSTLKVPKGKSIKLSDSVQNLNNIKQSINIDFDDNLKALNDDFELIESLINENMIDGCDVNRGNSNNFLDSNMNDDKINSYHRKYSDDMSPIDPRLINETDNLLIPDNLKIDKFLPSSNDNSNLVNKENLQRSLSVPLGSSKNNISKRNTPTKRPGKLAIHQTPPKSTISLTSSFGGAKSNLSNNKTKNALLLKRSTSLEDSSKSKASKDKQKPQNYFQQHENILEEGSSEPNEQVIKINQGAKGDTKELFFPSDELCEEYEKYKEAYLHEKQQKLDEHASSGTLTPNEDASNNNNANVKISADSAYSSLNRKAPKVRAHTTKITQLTSIQPQISLTPSPTSSGSEASISPIFNKRSNENQRMSKFCHECGNQYPINTAKFCVECGVKRLIL